MRILRELADKLHRDGLDDCYVRDVNGNRVGAFTVLKTE